MGRHPTQEALLRYLTGRTLQEKRAVLEQHLGSCQICNRRLSAIRSIRTDFDRAYAAFAEEVFGPPPQAFIQMHFLLESGRRLATAAVRAIDTHLAGRGWQWTYAPVYSGVRDASIPPDAQENLRKASELCGQEKDQDAMEILDVLKQKGVEQGEVATLNFQRDSASMARVVVDAGRRSVSVIVDAQEAIPVRSVVVMTRRTESGIERREAILEKLEATTRLLAEFEDVPTGSFDLEIFPPRPTP